MQLACLDAWVVTVLTCFEQTEKRGGTRQKVYAGTPTSHVNEAMNQLIGLVRSFQKIRKPEELELPANITQNNSEGDKSLKALRHPSHAKPVVRVPSVSRIYISVESEWSIKQLWSELGLIYDCHIQR